MDHSAAHPASRRAVSLGGLSDLSLEARTDEITSAGGRDLRATVERLAHDIEPFTPALTIERLAWTVACNIDGLHGADDPTGTRSIRSYRDRWSLDTSWSDIWAMLVAERVSAHQGHSTTLLSELAQSVACEQRDDWQHPLARPVNREMANRAFEGVYETHRRTVLGVVRGQFGERAGSADVIAGEAWSRVFADYWSVRARRRFLGLCRISTLVSQVARYVAIDTLRADRARDRVEREVLRRKAASPSPLPTSLDDEEPDLPAASLNDLGITIPSDAVDPAAIDQSTHVYHRRLVRQLRMCIDQFPARQRLVARMVWFREIRAKRVAEMLSISEPAVSQQLKKSREAVRRCLTTYGFEAVAPSDKRQAPNTDSTFSRRLRARLTGEDL